MSRVWLALGLLLASWGVGAEPPSDPLAWLGRIATAGQRLNYTGTFTYQSGNRSETSRIVHLRDGSGEFERLETLDGSPREVIRNNGEVRCVLPAQKTIIIDQAGSRRAFPSRLAEAWMNLSESYRIRRGELARVAGLEAQQIILEPKDDLRYGYLLWADVQSGLLVKSRMVNERGETIEQFAFNDVKVGGDVDRAQLRSRFAAEQGSAGWQVVNARGDELRNEDSGWVIKAALPGFYQTSSVRRQLGATTGDTLHMVFSDGLAAVSVFIEPVAGAEGKVTPGPFQSGAINLYKRVVGGYLITALGEVPPRTAQRLAEAVEPARR
jgi:sigma-E factor negative regulatory protein RseB